MIRKLRRGEVIELRDYILDGGEQIPSCFVGHKVGDCKATSEQPYYRELPDKPKDKGKRKYPRRINLKEDLLDIMDMTGSNWIKVDEIIVLIQNNYRRRRKD